MHCIGHLIVRWQWIILNNAFYVHCIAWSSHDLKGLTMNDSCVFIENDGSRRKFSKTHSNAKYSPIRNEATKFLNSIWIFKMVLRSGTEVQYILVAMNDSMKMMGQGKNFERRILTPSILLSTLGPQIFWVQFEF